MDTKDVAGPARTFFQWLLTVGAAILYAFLVFKISLDVWVGHDTVQLSRIVAGVMNSIAVIFGSAFVGWFGVTQTNANVSVTTQTEMGWTRKWSSIVGQLISDLAGAAVFAMAIYLLAGAFAGLTYLFNESETPIALITVATAWATQASAIVAATLTKVLKAP